VVAESNKAAYQRGYLDGMAKPCVDCADRNIASAIRARASMRSVNDVARDEDLIRRIKALGGGSYQDVSYLQDGTIIGIGDLMFTRAIYIDLDLNGWGKRFCFEDRDLAVAEYAKLQTGDDEPTGWVARRGR
jgi:hypothetical protein